MDRFGLLCRNIYEKKKITQRELAAAMDLSLGTCNHLIRDALADGLIALDPQTGEYSGSTAPSSWRQALAPVLYH